MHGDPIPPVTRMLPSPARNGANMVAASERAAAVVAAAQLLLFTLHGSARAEYFSSLLSFNGNSHLQKQGCVTQSEFGNSEDFVECGESLYFVCPLYPVRVPAHFRILGRDRRLQSQWV